MKKVSSWWVIGLVVVLQFVAVPFNYAAKDWPGISGWQDVMKHAFSYSLLNHMPVEMKFSAQIITLVVVAMFLWKRSFRLLATYAFVTYLAATIVQSIGISPKYGFCTVTVNLIQFPLVAMVWIRDAFSGETDTTYRSRSPWAYAGLPLAAFAFLAPESSSGLLVYMLTSGTTFGFCLMTPVYLALIFMSYPRISRLNLIVTGTVGFIISLYNMYGAANDWGWYVGLLHAPLFILCLAAIILSFKVEAAQVQKPNGTGLP